MKRYSIPALITLAIFAAYWAYSIGDTLIREFGINLTLIDLGALFVLGLTSGIALGLAVRIKNWQKV